MLATVKASLRIWVPHQMNVSLGSLATGNLAAAPRSSAVQKFYSTPSAEKRRLMIA